MEEPEASRRKLAGSFDRAVPLERTLALANALRERYGITRLGETTYLDRIGIPTMTAIVPESPDLIGVYNGKGVTKAQASASALMEAIERQICARMEGIARVRVPVATVRERVDLDALGWLGAKVETIECVRGVDLRDGAVIDVPLGLVQCPRVGPRHFAWTTTNGLASGNTRTEALYHALFELIERHLWSRVHLLAHLWPRTLRSATGSAGDVPDDPVATEIALDDDLPPPLHGLIAAIRAAGVWVRLLAYSEPGWPVGMLACVSEPGDDTLFYHLGMGASWSPLHAAVRAVTEAVQVRAGDIQGARENLQLPGEGARGFEHGRRPSGYPRGRWYFDGPAKAARFGDYVDRSSSDLGEEVARLVALLGVHDAGAVAAVDLTPPGLDLAVVRVVVAGLERGLADGSLSARGRALLTNPLAGFQR